MLNGKLKLILCGVIFLARTAVVHASQESPLTVRQIAVQALRVSPLVRQAEQKMAQAQAGLGEARARRRLQVSLNSTVSGARGDVYLPPPSRESFDSVENTITIPIPVGSKLLDLEEEAKNIYAGAKARLAGVRIDVAGRVENGCFTLLETGAILSIAKENLRQAESELNAARERFRAGDVANLDVLKAEVPVATAQSDLLTAKSNFLIARQTLNALLRLPLDSATAVADIPAPSVLTFDLNTARALAFRNSPAVLEAAALVDAGRASLQAAAQGHVPVLAFQGSDLRSGDLTGFSRLDSAGVTMTFPLFDGGLVREQVNGKRASVEDAYAALLEAEQEAELKASDAFVNAQGELGKVSLLEKAVSVAGITLKKTREGYAAGLLPIIDVLNAQREYTKARLARAEAVYDAASAVWALDRSVGKEMP